MGEFCSFCIILHLFQNLILNILKEKVHQLFTLNLLSVLEGYYCICGQSGSRGSSMTAEKPPQAMSLESASVGAASVLNMKNIWGC